MQGQVILLVDDEPSIRESMAMLLEMEGYSILEAGHGFEAVEVMKNNKVDCVVTDMRMPECDGVELLRIVKKEFSPQPPIFIVTGYSDLSPEQAFTIGAYGYFDKPINTKLLFAAIGRALSGREKSWQENNDNQQLLTKIEVDEKSEVLFGQGGFFIPAQYQFCKRLEVVKYNFFVENKGEKICVDGTGRIQWKSDSGLGIEILTLNSDAADAYDGLIMETNEKSFIPSPTKYD